MPNGRLRRNTREIKSCNRKFLCGTTVACLQKERKRLCSLGHSIHCSVRGSQVHEDASDVEGVSLTHEAISTSAAVPLSGDERRSFALRFI